MALAEAERWTRIPSGLRSCSSTTSPGRVSTSLNSVKTLGNHFFSQLIDVLTQLRQLEFDAAGSFNATLRGWARSDVPNFLNIYRNDVKVENQGEAASPETYASATDFAVTRIVCCSCGTRRPQWSSTPDRRSAKSSRSATWKEP